MACPKSPRWSWSTGERRVQLWLRSQEGVCPAMKNWCRADRLHPRRGSGEGTGKTTLQWAVLSPLKKAHSLFGCCCRLRMLTQRLLQKAVPVLFAVSTSIIFAFHTVWGQIRKENERSTAFHRGHWFLLDALQEFCLALLWLPPLAVWTSKWATTVVTWI